MKLFHNRLSVFTISLKDAIKDSLDWMRTI